MNTEQMIEVMQAFVDGKKIEWTYRGKVPGDDWLPSKNPIWDWDCHEYRIAPEPKKEGQWERVEIRLSSTPLGYMLPDGLCIDACFRVPGFGGIDYQSPFDPKIIVRSMVPLMFEETGGWATFDFAEHYRPGIPVAAWFWKEGEK